MGAKKRKLFHNATLSAFAARGFHQVQPDNLPQDADRQYALATSQVLEATTMEPVKPSHHDQNVSNDASIQDCTGPSDDSASDSGNRELHADLRRHRLQRLADKISKVKAQDLVPQKDSYVLRRGQVLFIVGEFDLMVLDGAVTVYGAKMRSRDTATPSRVFAPPTHAIPGIESVADSSTIRLIQVPYRPSKASHIHELSHLSPSFRHLWPETDHRGKELSRPLWTPSGEGSNGGNDMLYRPIDLEHWQHTISRLCRTSASAPIFQICGPGGRGKATFARHIINGMVSQNIDGNIEQSPPALLLDLDFSSQEFSPPGQISLYEISRPILGPSYHHVAYSTRAHKTLRAHTVTLGAFENDQKHFLSCFRNLFDHARHLQKAALSEGHSLPLVVKCCAWISGEQDVLKEMTRKLKPTYVVCLNMWKQTLSEDHRICYLDGIREPSMIALEEVLDRPEVQISCPMAHPWILDPTPYLRQPAQLQEMQLLSYFHHSVGSDGEIGWNAEPLIMQRPLQLSYNRARPDFACIYVPHTLPPMHESMISTLLTGKIVSIVILEEGAKTLDEGDILRGQGDGLPYLGPDSETKQFSPLDPEMSHTIGLGLVKAIDTEAKIVQMYTRVATSALQQYDLKRAVLFLDCSLPTGWAYEEHLHYNGRSHGDFKVAVGTATPWITDPPIGNP